MPNDNCMAQGPTFCNTLSEDVIVSCWVNRVYEDTECPANSTTVLPLACSDEYIVVDSIKYERLGKFTTKRHICGFVCINDLDYDITHLEPEQDESPTVFSLVTNVVDLNLRRCYSCKRQHLPR